MSISRAERQKLVQLAIDLRKVSDGLVTGRLETDQASHFIKILSSHIRIDQVETTKAISWWDDESRALKEFLA